MGTNIWGENVLDSKDYFDEESVLYQNALRNNILKEEDNDSEIRYFNMSGELVKGSKTSGGIKKIVLADFSINNLMGKPVKRKVEAIDKLINEGRILNVPSVELMNKVESLYSYAREGGYEKGYVVASDGYVSSKKTSERGNEIKLGSLYDEVLNQDKTPSFDIHTHPVALLGNGDIDTQNIGVAYPSGEIGGDDRDFGTTKIYESRGWNNAPCWVLGFFLNIRKDDEPLENMINFYTSNWVYIDKQSKLVITPTSGTIGGITKSTSTNQGTSFEGFKNAVKKIRNA